MCSGRAAWQINPLNEKAIVLSEIADKIVSAGWECTLVNRLCYTFSGEVNLTLYPSGKLLVKTNDKQLAEKIAIMHLEDWLSN
tara:strand:- start:199 stop:447 length:249 start_codon:yes stop_codon:yes gene_type:complete